MKARKTRKEMKERKARKKKKTRKTRRKRKAHKNQKHKGTQALLVSRYVIQHTLLKQHVDFFDLQLVHSLHKKWGISECR